MDDKYLEKFRQIIKEEISIANHSLINTYFKPLAKKVDILWAQVATITEDLTEIKSTLKIHSKQLKRIEIALSRHNANIHNLDKRVAAIESKLDIDPSPELTILD